MTPGNARRARFGPFEFDPRSGELQGPAGTTLLSKQLSDLLEILVEHAPDIATRDEIRKKLWPNTTFIEFELGIRAATRKLRGFLTDSAEEPKYIETLKKRGYRLMVPVEWADASPAVARSTQSFQVDRLSGLTVSHYRIGEIIGRGGMGIVYRAQDLNLSRAVAMKFLPEELADDKHALVRFKSEACAVSTVDHPNICPVYEFDAYKGHPFIAMQLLQGQTLREHIIDGRFCLSEPEGLEIAIQIARGLQAAHEEGIIHRDIKPANIFITERNVAKILDFGVAVVFEVAEPSHIFGSALNPGVAWESSDAPPTGIGEKFGTAGYMSPEQIRGEMLDVRTDIFSFGLVLYEMATGDRAFSSDLEAVEHAILNLEPRPLRQLAPRVSHSLEAIIGKCLQKRREDRYATASALLAALVGARSAAQTAKRAAIEGPRILEAAAPSESTVDKPMEVIAMVRRARSQGLREYLQLEILPRLSPEDVRARPFRFQFEIGEDGEPLPTKIALRLESPSCSPICQTKKLIVPVNGDSEPCMFQITPLHDGDLVLLLELLNAEEHVIVSRPLRTSVVRESRAERPTLTFVTIPLESLPGWMDSAAGTTHAGAGMEERATSSPAVLVDEAENPPDKIVSELGTAFKSKTGGDPVTGKRAFATPVFPPASVHGNVVDGRYRLIKVIAHGGMGTVYLAEALQTGTKEPIIVGHRPQIDSSGRIEEPPSELAAPPLPPKSWAKPRWLVALAVFVFMALFPSLWLSRYKHAIPTKGTIPIKIVVARFSTSPHGDRSVAGTPSPLLDAQQIVAEQLAKIPDSQVSETPGTYKDITETCRDYSAALVVTGEISSSAKSGTNTTATHQMFTVTAIAWNCSNADKIASADSTAETAEQLPKAIEAAAAGLRQKIVTHK